MATQLQRRVMQAVREGMRLDEIELSIIEPSPLGEDEKAALWLLAQVLQERAPIIRRPALVDA